MWTRKAFVNGILTACLTTAIALGGGLASADEHGKSEKKGHDKMDMGPKKAICVLTPTEGSKASGWVKFTRQKGGILIEAEVKGLEPNSKHGFHVHEFGDVSGTDGKATGGHFNPGGHDHSGPEADTRHVGDFGNIEADENGVGTYKRLDTLIKFRGKNSVLGRGMIVHAGTDDLTSQPTGDAGSRIAQGVIGVDADE